MSRKSDDWGWNLENVATGNETLSMFNKSPSWKNTDKTNENLTRGGRWNQKYKTAKYMLNNFISIIVDILLVYSLSGQLLNYT